MKHAVVSSDLVNIIEERRPSSESFVISKSIRKALK